MTNRALLLENLLSLRNGGLGGIESQTALLNELLPLLGLAEEEKKLALEYSHGMKKKLALAAALLPNPDLLFLDEPFEGVDAVTSRVIRDIACYSAR